MACTRFGFGAEGKVSAPSRGRLTPFRPSAGYGIITTGAEEYGFNGCGLTPWTKSAQKGGIQRLECLADGTESSAPT